MFNNNVYDINAIIYNNIKVINMLSEDRALARKQLDKRLDFVRSTDALTRPPRGWIKAIREALGMTTAQIAKRMGVSQPRAVEIEKAEKMGAITLDTLERAARAMDCKLVYAFVSKQPLELLVEDRAQIIAKQRLAITGHSMALEAQPVSADDVKEQFDLMVRRIVERAGSDIWKES
ncbi:MAG: mobile mystery protein A [Thiotrichaceae bacterium]|nr:mobile mystery protein A [Thiotrichaceae bacterium]